jgi:hypothetical protein
LGILYQPYLSNIRVQHIEINRFAQSDPETVANRCI